MRKVGLRLIFAVPSAMLIMPFFTNFVYWLPKSLSVTAKPYSALGVKPIVTLSIDSLRINCRKFQDSLDYLIVKGVREKKKILI